MQAARQSSPFVVPSQFHNANRSITRARLIGPVSFVRALNRGWKVLSEKTVLGADKRHRHGTVTLTRPGMPNLVVDYTGTIRQGFRFGKPRLA
jgi:hypothetical protein